MALFVPNLRKFVFNRVHKKIENVAAYFRNYSLSFSNKECICLKFRCIQYIGFRRSSAAYMFLLIVSTIEKLTNLFVSLLLINTQIIFPHNQLILYSWGEKTYCLFERLLFLVKRNGQNLNCLHRIRNQTFSPKEKFYAKVSFKFN